MKLSNIVYVACISCLGVACASSADDASTSANDLTTTPPTPTHEVEPNNDPAHATPLPSDTFEADGTVTLGDVDYWEVTFGKFAASYDWNFHWAGHGLTIDATQEGDPTVYHLLGADVTPTSDPIQLIPGAKLTFKLSAPGATAPISYQFSQTVTSTPNADGRSSLSFVATPR